MIWSRRQFLQALGVAAAGSGVASAASASSSTRPAYVGVREVASRFGMKIVVQNEKSVVLKGAGATLSFVPRQQRVQVNTTYIWLNSPVVALRDSWAIRSADLWTVLDPLMRPRTYLQTAGARVVVLDAGHGDNDVGTMGRRYRLLEKNLTLDLAQRLRVKLVNAGYKTFLTRDRDRFIELDDRPALARKWKADLFLSLHFNSGGADAVGVETYVLTPRGYASTGSLRASSSWYGGNGFDAANIIAGYYLQNRLRVRMGTPDRGVRHARFAVLRSAPCPAALVECGFLSHRKTEESLRGAAYRDALATGLCTGVSDYFKQVAASRPKPKSK